MWNAINTWRIINGQFATTNTDTVGSVCSSMCLHLSCAVFFIDETARRSFRIKITWQFSQKMKGVAYWNGCHVAAHMSVPTTYVLQVTGVEILICFGMIHIKDMDFFGIYGNWMESPRGGYAKPIVFIKSVWTFLSHKKGKKNH